MPFQPPTPQMIRDARMVVLNPHSSATLRANAWAVLKTARGQNVNQTRIRQMQQSALGLQILTGGAA